MHSSDIKISGCSRKLNVCGNNIGKLVFQSMLPVVYTNWIKPCTCICFMKQLVCRSDLAHYPRLQISCYPEFSTNFMRVIISSLYYKPRTITCCIVFYRKMLTFVSPMNHIPYSALLFDVAKPTNFDFHVFLRLTLSNNNFTRIFTDINAYM